MTITYDGQQITDIDRATVSDIAHLADRDHRHGGLWIITLADDTVDWVYGDEIEVAA